MTEIVFAFGLLLFLLAWWRWQLVSLDTCRDRLFDLRDRLRDYFQEQDRLASPAYAEVRNSLNAMIRYTEKFTLWTVLLEIRLAKRFPDIFQSLENELEATFEHLDQKESEFIMQIRQFASFTMGIYLVESNLLLFVCSLVSWPLVLIGNLKRRLSGFQAFKNAVSQKTLSPVIQVKQFETLARISCT